MKCMTCALLSSTKLCSGHFVDFFSEKKKQLTGERSADVHHFS